MRTSLSLGLGLLVAFAAPSAMAQDQNGTAGGSVSGGASTEQLPAPPKATASASASAAPANGAAAAGDETADHEKVVGKFAVGYLGLTQLPIGQGAAAGATAGSVNAPVIGARYWLNSKLGIDGGLGLAVASGSTENVAGATTTTVDRPSVFGLALHGGVPLVFAYAKHYSFLIVPELNFGFTTQTEKPAGNPPPAGVGDTTRSGFRFDVGGRIGSEIQFGFIGIPQLSLQATVGVYLRYDKVKVSQDVNNVTTSSSISSTTLGTSVQSDPWALFVNNISALYYFP